MIEVNYCHPQGLTQGKRFDHVKRFVNFHVDSFLSEVALFDTVVGVCVILYRYICKYHMKITRLCCVLPIPVMYCFVKY